MGQTENIFKFGKNVRCLHVCILCWHIDLSVPACWGYSVKQTHGVYDLGKCARAPPLSGDLQNWNSSLIDDGRSFYKRLKDDASSQTIFGSVLLGFRWECGTDITDVMQRFWRDAANSWLIVLLRSTSIKITFY